MPSHRSLLAPVLFLALSQTTVAATQGGEPLAPHSTRVTLRGVATDLSRLGLREEVQRLRDVLLALGDPPDTLERLGEKWERNLERGAHGRDPAAAVRKLRAEAGELAERLEDTDAERRRALAELVLALDAEEPRANELLGRVRHRGRWVLPETIERERGHALVADMLEAAHRMKVAVELAPSESPVLRALYGEPGTEARAHGVVLLARMEPSKLERILRQALRAAALSNVLLKDVLEIPRLSRTYTIVVTDSEASYAQALDEAVANGGLSHADREHQEEQRMRSFQDKRGWRTTRWRTEADHQALVLWAILHEWLGADAQPCLEAGHLNWLSLSFLGTSMPLVAWQETTGGHDGPARTTSERQVPFQAEALWRSARRSLFGCRSWMIHRVLEGKDPPWSRSMVDHVGKITDEVLLKTTLVVGYLQEQRELASLLEATRAKEDRVAAFEAALGEPLPDFERGWARWLLDERPAADGIVQAIERPAASAWDPGAAALVEELNRIRHRALKGQWAEFESVAVDPDLSAGALAHARYLARHPDQQNDWPEAHEEWADREGFTPEGSRAGLHGVIAYTDDVTEALDQWMGSFFHRLPLLDPGLFGVGLGITDGVTVLDVSSLVAEPWREHWVAWPHDGMRDVPLSFQPEIPNPVPGADMSGLGYPVTLQVVLAQVERDPRVTLRLLEGARDGPEVECHAIAPDAPLFPEHAPERAWCLIPRRPLARGTTYTVVAECIDPPKTLAWSFTTSGQ